MQIIRITAAFLLLLLSFTSVAGNCAYGCPTGKSGQLIERPIYTLQNNANTKFADWVAYKVTSQTIDGPTRSRNWRQDPSIPATQTLVPADYTNANAVLGTDRGHQVPLASFSNTAHWATTNYLSNITPQAANLNQGPWARLENAVRVLARSGQDVYVVSGPLYEWHFGRLPATSKAHTIPSGYFKMIVTDNNGWVEASSFIMDQNTARNANYCSYEVTGFTVEHRSGLNIMPNLPGFKVGPVFGQTGGLRSELGC